MYYPLLNLQYLDKCLRYTTSTSNLVGNRIEIHQDNMHTVYYFEKKRIPELSKRGMVYKLVGTIQEKPEDDVVFFEMRGAIWDGGNKYECLILFHENADKFIDLIFENSIDFLRVVSVFRDKRLINNVKTFNHQPTQHPNFKSFSRRAHHINDIRDLIPNPNESNNTIYYAPCPGIDYDHSIVRFASDNIDRIYAAYGDQEDSNMIILRLFHPRCYVVVICYPHSFNKHVYYARDLDIFINYSLNTDLLSDKARKSLVDLMKRDVYYISLPPSEKKK